MSTPVQNPASGAAPTAPGAASGVASVKGGGNTLGGWKPRVSAITSRETQLKALRARAAALIAEDKATQATAELLEVIEQLHQETLELKQRISVVSRIAFGSRSERFRPGKGAQPDFDFLGYDGAEPLAPPAIAPPEGLVPPAEAPEGEEQPVKRKRPNHKGRTPLSKDLERRITEVPLSDAERLCSVCGAEMTRIAPVEHERVEYVPAKLIVHVERREKCACRKCRGDIATAPRTGKAPDVRAGTSLLGLLVEGKCCDALPIHRQQAQLERLGFTVSTNTLYRYFAHAADQLAPIAELIGQLVRAEDLGAVDDTRLEVIDADHPKGKYRGHLWCFVGQGPLVAFTFTENWEAATIAPWLSQMKGFVQCDDYAGYARRTKRADGTEGPLVPDERRLGCFMHVRRGFYACDRAKDVRARPGVVLIRKLYAIERKAKERGLDAAGRHAVRQEKSLPLLDAFYVWVREWQPEVLPKSSLGRAIAYALNQEAYIRRCFTEGRFEIDNGRAERSLRRICIGRRNFLFTGSARGGARLADAYTVVESCRLLGISPREYLTDVLAKLEAGWPRTRLRELLPDAWAAARSAPALEQAA